MKVSVMRYRVKAQDEGECNEVQGIRLRMKVSVMRYMVGLRMKVDIMRYKV